MFLVARLLLDNIVNMVKHKYTELKDAIVNSLRGYHKNFKCGCLTEINYTKYQMDSRKLVRAF